MSYFIFFFKQKTAYEMRISDWSSDVCSSDLPTGTLFEYATDTPGFTVDEDPDHLGETLLIPPGDAARGNDLRVMLPQFALPEEDRMPMRDLPFVHRFHTSDDPDGSVIRPEERRGGKECVSSCCLWWSP